MDTFRGHTSLSRRLRNAVVAIGNFDGVHRGHAHIFQQARGLAASLDGESVVLTFDPHPAKVLAPAYAPPLITPLSRKLELIAAEGVDVAVVEPFDRAFAARTPDAFVKEVLADGLGARHVVVGYDFTFGAKRSGTVQLLADLGPRHGFGVTVVPPVSVEGIVCSSTKVREFVLEGRVDGAALVLGRAPEVEGEVVRGDGRGRTIGVPTANVRPATELMPKNGVYAGWALRISDKKRWTAAINVGTNPTFVEGQTTRVEAHLLDCDEDLYGQQLRVGFVARLRDEERFASKDALVAQIHKDIEATRRIGHGS
ncbi:MAG TPA: bifunctional riboflavin kinase/FAD synthetase [Polyangia bacterium]|nr:bifunctional riboflavin kinase/FAD synthetase [Polyangia bacterium]